MKTREQNPHPRRAWSVREVAEAYGFSAQHVYDLVRTNELGPVIRVGKSIRIPADVLEAWDARNRQMWTDKYLLDS